MTVFEKIAKREIPAKIVYEDNDLLAFHDANPQAPVHILIIPKRHITRLADAKESDAALLGGMLLAARKIAKQQDVEKSGYRLVINNGPDAGESVPHLHMHLLARRPMSWPPG
jgi:histidine triad (HIT) family protein